MRERAYRDLAEEFERRSEQEFEDRQEWIDSDGEYEPDFEEMMIRKGGRNYEAWQ